MRRFLLSVALLFALVVNAYATTVTITVAGSAITGANQTKSYTVTDTDLQAVINWATVTYAASLPPTPTVPQVLLAWVQSWINATKNAVVQFQTPPPVSPAPPNFQ